MRMKRWPLRLSAPLSPLIAVWVLTPGMFGGGRRWMLWGAIHVAGLVVWLIAFVVTAEEASRWVDLALAYGAGALSTVALGFVLHRWPPPFRAT